MQFIVISDVQIKEENMGLLCCWKRCLRERKLTEVGVQSAMFGIIIYITTLMTVQYIEQLGNFGWCAEWVSCKHSFSYTCICISTMAISLIPDLSDELSCCFISWYPESAIFGANSYRISLKSYRYLITGAADATRIGQYSQLNRIFLKMSKPNSSSGSEQYWYWYLSC